MKCECGETDETKFYDSNKSKCKNCVRKVVDKRRKDNIDKVREYDRNRPNKKERVIANAQRIERYKTENPKMYKKYIEQKNDWRKRNRLKQSAHNKVAKALLKGSIVRPLHCERCINTDIQTHHADYSKPLEVIWLCVECHNLEHIELREAIRNED